MNKLFLVYLISALTNLSPFVVGNVVITDPIKSNQLQEKGGTIYFSRPDIYAGSLSKLDVSVNGVVITSMKNNSTFIFPLPAAGNITVSVSPGGVSKVMAKAQEITFTSESGKSYFIEVGWTNSLTKPIYIKLVSYEQFAGRFPELSGKISQGSLQTAIQYQDKEAQSDSKLAAPAASPKIENAQSVTVEKNKNIASVPISDVDKNIPIVTSKKQYLFALIIGNEDYSSFQSGLGSEVNVAFAQNDAKVFREYAVRTLGVPEENAILLLNARAIEMNRAITKINLFAKNLNGKAEIIIYYAGHGFPDEITREPYLMPVDVSGSDLQFAVKLNDLYKKMTEYPVLKVTIFLDACFSGGGRDAGLVAARGVKIKPKETELNGNLAVFTSSSGDQSSLTYKDQQHGMFTYFLLKKLQETKGRTSYKELAGYLSEQVGLNSIRINDKEQNPQVNISPEAQGTWETWSFTK